jgi:hypothetical protein
VNRHASCETQHLCMRVCDDDDVEVADVLERREAAAQAEEGNSKLMTAGRC